MLVLSIIGASKNVFGTAGDKDKQKTSHAANDACAKSTAEAGRESGKAETPVVRGDAAQELGDGDFAERQETSQGAERGLWRRRRAGVRRDTPGWRAWEAR